MPLRLALAMLVATAVYAGDAAAQNPPAYYCDPLHVYYPAVPRCPVPWRAVYPTPSASQPAPPAPATAEPTAAYRQGASDWRDLQAWFELQTGDRRAGADFWAGNRSKPDHKSCEDAGRDFSGEKSALVAGCVETKQRLDPLDARRRSEPEFRAGFNDAAKRLPLQAGSAPQLFSGPQVPVVTSSFTINNRTCLRISAIKTDDIPQEGVVGPADTANFEIVNASCSHTVQGSSDTGLNWTSRFQCKDG